MLHPEDFPISESDLYENNWSNLSYQSLSYTTNRGVLLDDTYSTQQKIFNPVTYGENDVMFALNNVDRNYVWENSCFWIVGSTDELKATNEDDYIMTSIEIPSMIDGVVVAGIGYGALNDVVIMNLHIEGLSSMDIRDVSVVKEYTQIPFYIMPYGINNSIIGHILSDRASFIYSLGLNNIELHNLKFNRTTYVYDSSFYKVTKLWENYFKVYDGEAQDVFKTFTFEYLSFPGSVYNDAPLINGVFVDCEFSAYDNGYKTLFNTANFYGSYRYLYNGEYILHDTWISNYQENSEFRSPSNISELTLRYPLLKSLYTENQEIKWYLNSEELVLGLKKIYLMGTVSTNADTNSDFYLDENNIIYFLSSQTTDKSNVYIKIFKVPANCELVEIEKQFENYNMLY